VSLIQETGRFNPVHLGHYEIHQREMRRVEMKGRQRMVTTEGFPNYDPFGMLLQRRFESAPRGRTVIDYKDTDQANSFRCRKSGAVDSPPKCAPERKGEVGFASLDCVALMVTWLWGVAVSFFLAPDAPLACRANPRYRQNPPQSIDGHDAGPSGADPC